MARHAAVYCRISSDRNGRAEGVGAQEKWGLDYAASAWPGLAVVVYKDNDISASNGDHRPGYEALRQAVAAGDVAHVWCVEQSRLERREVGWFVLAAELVTAGISEIHTNRDGIVRVGDDIAGIKAVLNAGEIRKLTRRINDRLAENAANGTAPGSLPFGYAHGVNDDGAKTYVVVPRQAEAIRWAAEKVLAGWSLSKVRAGLCVHGPHRAKVRDAAGLVLLDDGRWAEAGDAAVKAGRAVTRPTALSATSVRSMLTNPTVANWRVHRGRTVGRGNWEPILDDETWQACRAKLTGPRTVQRSDGGTYPVGAAHSGHSGRKYTLTGGLAVCGVCGKPLVGSLKQLNGGKRVVPYLLCHPKTGGRACVGIMLEATERNVADRLFAELDKPEFLAEVAADHHGERREQIKEALKDSDKKRAKLAALWDAGELTDTEWQTARRARAEAEQALRAELAAVPPPVATVSIEDARAAWPDMELGEQREFLRLFIARVIIRRAKPGTKGFDEGRVGIEWRKR